MQDVNPIPAVAQKPLHDSGFWVALFFLAAITAVGLYDTLATFSGGKWETASTYIREWHTAYPGMGFFAGMLAYHLWFK